MDRSRVRQADGSGSPVERIQRHFDSGQPTSITAVSTRVYADSTMDTNVRNERSRSYTLPCRGVLPVPRSEAGGILAGDSVVSLGVQENVGAKSNAWQVAGRNSATEKDACARGRGLEGSPKECDREVAKQNP